MGEDKNKVRQPIDTPTDRKTETPNRDRQVECRRCER